LTDDNIDKMQPPVEPEDEVNFDDFLEYSLCPYCDRKVITTDQKKTIVIAYCHLCDIVWKVNYVSKYDHCIINEMEFGFHISDDSE
jgi:hypothetical protein